MTIAYLTNANAIPAASKWSNEKAIPAIGALVKIRMNGLGFGIVRGYFLQEGYTGVCVELETPPEWYRKQVAQQLANRVGLAKHCHAFGAEIDCDVFQPVKSMKAAREILKPLRMNIRKTECGEYRVNMNGAREITAAYDCDLTSAVQTAIAMREHETKNGR